MLKDIRSISIHGGNFETPSHRYDQTRNMQIDFFSLISESEKRRTAKDILCFMELLNSPHIKSHLGNDATSIIDGWCDEILSSEIEL